MSTISVSPAAASSPDPTRPRIKVNVELRFFHEVLGLDHLHYGLWDGEPLTKEGLKVAQERYAQTLCDWVPSGVKSVLDIGCGAGQSAIKLTEHGFEVEGLSPDPYQREIFTRRTGLPFHLTRLQEYEPARTYDLALMSESAQYVHLPQLFPSIQRVAAGGHLLVCDYFMRPDGGTPTSDSGHRIDEFLEAASRHGFEVQRREDITDQVTPTLDLADEWVSHYVFPAAQLLLDAFAAKRPKLFRLARGWLRKQARRLEDAQKRTDSDAFKESKSYEIILFRHSGADPAP